MHKRQQSGGKKRPSARIGRHSPPGTPRSARRQRPGRLDERMVILYGWHSMLAALQNPRRRFSRILVTENALHRLERAGVPLPVAPEVVRPDAIANLLPADAVHQGLYAEAAPLPTPNIDEISSGLLLVLDQITDPHNFGAIVRSAAAFAVSAIITTARHSPEASGVLAKSASGGLEHVPVVLVQNLARAMSSLKERGFLLVGLDEAGTLDLAEAPLRAPLALVIGAEGKGLRQLTRETCDLLARIDLPGAIKSLNVSNATALALQLASHKLRAGR